MNRRGFLGRLMSLPVTAGTVLSISAELEVPKRTIFLPPRGGWISNACGRIVSIDTDGGRMVVLCEFHNAEAESIIRNGLMKTMSRAIDISMMIPR